MIRLFEKFKWEKKLFFVETFVITILFLLDLTKIDNTYYQKIVSRRIIETKIILEEVEKVLQETNTIEGDCDFVDTVKINKAIL